MLHNMSLFIIYRMDMWIYRMGVWIYGIGMWIVNNRPILIKWVDFWEKKEKKKD